MVKNYHAGNLLSPAIESLLDKKLAKLDKFADDFVCDIYMSVEGKDHMTKMLLKSKNYDLVAQTKSNDMYKNIDVCIDNLKAQLTKEKPMKKHAKHARAKVKFED